LKLMQARIDTALLKQLVLRATLDNSAFLENNDAAGRPDSRETVRNDDGRPVLH